MSISYLIDLDAALAALGHELPADARLIIETRTAALEAATSDPVGDLRAAVRAGKVTPKTARTMVLDAAAALTVKEKARELVRELEPEHDRAAKQWAKANGDAVLETLRPTFDAAAELLTAAVAVLGANADATDVLAAGPAAAKAWGEREDAVAVLNRVRSCRKALSRSGYGEVFEVAEWWLAPVATSDELAAARGHLGGSRFDVEAVVGAGYSLALNTIGEAEAVVTAAAAGSEAERLARAADDPAVIAHNRRVEAQAKALEAAAPR